MSFCVVMLICSVANLGSLFVLARSVI